MFDLFRSRAKAVRYFLGAILMLVAISMVVTLIPGFGTGGGGAQDQVVAEVGKEPLTVMEVSQAVQMQIRNKAFPSEMASVYVPQLIDQMVKEDAAAYEAQRLGFDVTKADVAQAIQTILPQLFQDGKFVGKEVYAAYLAQQNLTVPQFEENLRKQLLINKLRTLVLEGVVVSPAEVEREYRNRNEKVKIEYVAISPDKYRSEVKISPEEIKAYYEKNKASFSIPEKRSLDLLVIDQDQVAQSISIPDSELRRMYTSEQDRFRVPERVKVRHILLKTTDVPKDQIPKITAQAEDILKQIRQGGNFAELAKKYSQDPGSAANGGDLGWIVRGQTVPAFEQAAFSMKPGQISNLITTQYGIHIIQVLEKQEAHLQPFEEVKGQLAEETKKQKTYDRMQTLADQAHAALSKAPQDAEKIAGQLGLQFVRVEKHTPGEPIPGIGVSKELADSTAPLRAGEVTPVIQIQPTKLAVAAVTAVLPRRPAELQEVETQIRQRLATEKLGQLVAQKARQVLDQAKSSGGDLQNIARSMGLEFKAPPEFTRNGAAEGLGSASSLSDAFTAAPGQVFGPIEVGNRMFVYKLVKKIPADMSQFASQREEIEQQLRTDMARERNDLFEEGLLNQLVKSGKVKVHQNVINRIVANYSSR